LRVVITGAGGQLGQELQYTSPVGVDLHAFAARQLDVADRTVVNKTIESLKPDVIINAAAYTDVDRAESAPEKAYAVNADGVGFLAEAARENGAKLVHISTDFVFDGLRCRPYLPADKTNPLSIYGASKWAGEERIAVSRCDSLIIRTSWVYSAHGRNFVKTMLRLMAERSELSIVADQIGTPTWARGLAKGIWRSVAVGLAGKQHWTDSGVASWYDFAQAIFEEALALGMLANEITIKPIRAKDYPTPAQRPLYSVLDKEGMVAALNYIPPHWRVNLRKMLLDLKGSFDE
jgi:dTDP-4-dehydrorhamnose reductase